MDSAPLTCCPCTVPVHPARSAAMKATLSAGTVDTEYLRCGSGRVVVALVAPELRARLLDGLAPHRRLIMPITGTAHAAGAPSFSTWLRDFLEGIGASSASLVVTDPACADAIEFAGEYESGLERLVVITSASHTFITPRALPTRVLARNAATLVEETVQFLLLDESAVAPTETNSVRGAPSGVDIS